MWNGAEENEGISRILINAHEKIRQKILVCHLIHFTSKGRNQFFKMMWYGIPVLKGFVLNQTASEMLKKLCFNRPPTLYNVSMKCNHSRSKQVVSENFNIIIYILK